jgi:integrase
VGFFVGRVLIAVRVYLWTAGLSWGYGGDEMTGHGFRSMASTLLNEQGWHRDAIERQLAHSERDNVRAAYNYAEHLPARRKMAWSS